MQRCLFTFFELWPIFAIGCETWGCLVEQKAGILSGIEDFFFSTHLLPLSGRLFNVMLILLSRSGTLK